MVDDSDRETTSFLLCCCFVVSFFLLSLLSLLSVLCFCFSIYNGPTLAIYLRIFLSRKKNWWMGEKDVIGHATQMHYFVGGDKPMNYEQTQLNVAHFTPKETWNLMYQWVFLISLLSFFLWFWFFFTESWDVKAAIGCNVLLIFFSFFCLSLTSFVITHAQNTVPPNRLFWTPILSIWWATEGHHTHTKSKVRLKSSDDIPSLDRWIVLFVIFLLFVIDQGEMWHEWNRQNTKGFFFIDTSTLKEKKKERQRRIKETNRFVPRTPRHIVRS